jgi:hypothetical protein
VNTQRAYCACYEEPRVGFLHKWVGGKTATHIKFADSDSDNDNTVTTAAIAGATAGADTASDDAVDNDAAAVNDWHYDSDMNGTQGISGQWMSCSTAAATTDSTVATATIASDADVTVKSEAVIDDTAAASSTAAVSAGAASAGNSAVVDSMCVISDVCDAASDVDMLCDSSNSTQQQQQQQHCSSSDTAAAASSSGAAAANTATTSSSSSTSGKRKSKRKKKLSSETAADNGHVQHYELEYDDAAQQMIAGLNPSQKQAVSEFMDASAPALHLVQGEYYTVHNNTYSTMHHITSISSANTLGVAATFTCELLKSSYGAYARN